MSKRIVNMKIRTLLICCLLLIISIPQQAQSNTIAQNSTFTEDMIKINPGLRLEYERQYRFESYYLDDDQLRFEENTSNETHIILNIDYSVGFLIVNCYWNRSHEEISWVYNTTMDNFGAIAIYAHWDYWETNVSTNHPFLFSGIDLDSQFDINILDKETEFGYSVSQDIEVETFKRISSHHKERKLVYSKNFGIKLEEFRLDVEAGPNGITTYNYRSYRLLTDLDGTLELNRERLFLILTILGLSGISIIVILKYRNTRRDRSKLSQDFQII